MEVANILVTRVATGSSAEAALALSAGHEGHQQQELSTAIESQSIKVRDLKVSSICLLFSCKDILDCDIRQ